MPRRDSEGGFTLIETLVAFAIVALLLLPLLRAVSQGAASTSRAEGVDRATLIAQSTLESMVPDGESARTGEVQHQDGPYHVAARVGLYTGPGAPSGAGLPLAPYEISVVVSWPEGARSRSFALNAIRLGPPPALERSP